MRGMAGYTEGPTLHHDEQPWPVMWEHGAVPELDVCAHEWERILLLADGPQRYATEEAVRCARCHVPRCGHTTDPDPCMERRHHKTLHIYLSGAFEPLGGYLLA